jgi:hypothetical protein
MADAGVHDNIAAALANAATSVKAPSFTLGQMDFYPLVRQCTGTALDMSLVNSDQDYTKDFIGTDKGTFTYRGAYAGQGSNSGWKLDSTLKSDAGTGAFVIVPRIMASRPVSMRVSAKRAANGVMVHISTPVARHITLGVYDVSGRCVGSMVQGALDAGVANIMLPLITSTGVYLVKLTTGTLTVADKIYFVR